MNKPIAIGIGYTSEGKEYEYPIMTEEHLAIVLSVGGKIK